MWLDTDLKLLSSVYSKIFGMLQKQEFYSSLSIIQLEDSKT